MAAVTIVRAADLPADLQELVDGFRAAVEFVSNQIDGDKLRHFLRMLQIYLEWEAGRPELVVYAAGTVQAQSATSSGLIVTDD